MSITCYVVQTEDIKEFSLRLFGDDNFHISKGVLRKFINSYGAKKGFTDYSDFKKDLEDFYNYVESELLDNSNFNEESYKILNNILKDTPELKDELTDEQSLFGLEFLNYNFNGGTFKRIALENGKYKIYLPLNVKEKTKSNQQEIDEIKLKATLDGTFMKAPNGKPTNLTERQWLHVRTKAFKEWFGDWENDTANASKVVDENGEPLVVYHGSKNQFNTFDFSKTKKLEGGFYFTSDRLYAKNYGTIEYPVFLNIKNPTFSNDINNETTESFIFSNALLSFFNPSYIPYDGIVGKDTVTGEFEHSSTGIEYVVIDSPNQIKSATDNIGSYSRENNNIYYQKDVLSEIQKLKLLQGPLKNRGSLSKQKESLKRARIDSNITNAIIKAVELDPSLGALSAYEIFELIASSRYRDLEFDYHKAIEEPIIEGLEEHLKQFLSKFHVDFVDGSKLCKEHGVTGAFDILNKVIHLAKDRNALTVPEEAAHAIVELLGAVPHKNTDKYPETKDVTFLLNNVENTSIYKRVFEEYKNIYVKEDGSPDIYKIKKEAIGQALAVAIRNNWENSVLETETTFWQKLKEFFDKILNYFKNSEYLSFDTLIDTIAKDVVKGDYKRFNKIDSKDWGVLDYSETIANQNKLDGGKALGFMQYFSKLGNIITGSLAYRKQGEVYRGKLDALHDIDMKVSANAHNINLQPYWEKEIIKPFGTKDTELLNTLLKEPYFELIVKKYPKIKFIQTIVNKNNKNTITISAVYSENDSLTEKFSNLDGAYSSRLDNFTEEERKQIYIFDFFLEDTNYDNYLKDTSNDINLTRWKDSMKVKVFEYGRAKDIFDYQSWKLFDEYKKDIPSEKQFLMFLKQQNELSIKTVNAKTPINKIEAFENQINAISERVTKSNNFENDHTYYIDGKKAELSVTQIFNSDPPSTASINMVTGTCVDNVVREFFKPKKGKLFSKDSIKDPNLPESFNNHLISSLQDISRFFDTKFGVGNYKVITEEKHIPGVVNGKTTVGTPDIIIITNTGQYYIIDLKTYGASSLKSEKKAVYSKQVETYHQLLAPYLDSQFLFAGGFLLPLHIDFIGDYKNVWSKTDFVKNELGIYVDRKTKKTIKDYLIEQLTKGFDDLVQIDQNSLKDAKLSITKLLIQNNKNNEEFKLEYAEVKKELELSEPVAPTVEEVIKEQQNEYTEQQEEDTQTEIRFSRVEIPNSNILPSDVNNAGKSIVKLFSYYVDLLSKNSVYKNIIGIKSESEYQGLESEQIIKRHFEEIKKPILDYIIQNHFSLNNVDIFSLPKEERAGFLLKNFIAKNIEQVFQDSFSTFLETENVSIKVEKKETEDDSSVSDREGDSREPYYIDNSEKSYIESIPTKLKRMLSIIPKGHLNNDSVPYDSTYTEIVDGNYWEKDEKNGLHQFYEQTEVVNKLFDLCYNCRSILSMMGVLEKEDSFFCKYVLDLLKADPHLLTLFYRTFRKSKTNYFSTNKSSSEGVSKIAPLFIQKSNLVNYYIDNIRNKITKSEQSIVNLDKEESYLFDLSKDGNITVNQDILNRYLKELLENFKNRNNLIKVLKNQLEELGISVSYINLNNASTIRIILRNFYLNSLKNQSSKNKKDRDDLSLLISKYRGLLYKLYPYLDKKTEMTVYDNGKTYMTYTEPTFILDTIQDFAENKWMDENKSKSTQFTIELANGDKMYLNSFYEDNKDNPDDLSLMQHFKRTTIFGDQYFDASDYDYTKSLITDYFFSVNNKSDDYDTDIAMYRILTMSDKPSSESYIFKKTARIYDYIDPDNAKDPYHVQEMKDVISEKAFRYFYYEMKRMKHVLYLLKKGSPNNDVAVFHLNRKSEGALILINSNEVTKEMFLDSSGNLRSEFLKSGFSFRYLTELNDIFTSNNADAEILVNGILGFLNGGTDMPFTSKEIIDLQNSFYSVFLNYMDKGFLSFNKYVNTIINNDAKENDSSFLNSIPGEEKKHKEASLMEFFYNDYLACLNQLNMTIGDPAYFKDTIDLQKRYAQVHSSTMKVNKLAKFFVQETQEWKNYSDGVQRFIILEDSEKESMIKGAVEKVLDSKIELAKKLGNIKDKEFYINLKLSIMPLYKNTVCTTDGQALSSPTGAWKKAGLLGEDTNVEFQEAIKAIRKGDYTKLSKYLNGISLVIKSFTYTLVPKKSNDNFNPIVPMQLKDSEAMLLSITMVGESSIDSPLKGVYDFLENSHYGFLKEHSDKTYSKEGIDLVVFKSAVKEGAVNVVNINGMNAQEAEQALKTAVTNGAVHQSDFAHWGKQQETPIHYFEHTVDLGSQIRILSVSDIPDSVDGVNSFIEVKLQIKGKTVTKKYSKKEFLKDYYGLLEEDFNEAIKEVLKQFGILDSAINLEKLHATIKQEVLKSVLKDSKLDKIIYDSVYEGFALSDPAVSSKVYSTLFSIIKKKVNKQNFPGGLAIQASDVLTSKTLYVRDSKGRIPTDAGYDLNNGYTVDIMTVPPNKEFAEEITVTKELLSKIKKDNPNTKYKIGEFLNVEDIIKYTSITELDLEMIVYRIPTEDKYSSFRGKIVGFLPTTSGEQIMLPYDTVLLSGFDFDIKLYWCH